MILNAECFVHPVDLMHALGRQNKHYIALTIHFSLKILNTFKILKITVPKIMHPPNYTIILPPVHTPCIACTGPVNHNKHSRVLSEP